jgi:enoyl-CoA hydratase/carnithine racemase
MRALPRQLVQQLVWLAEPVSARQLHAFGLVNRVTDSGQAFAEALAVAARLAEMAPNALAGAKELLNRAPEHSLAQQLEAERNQFIETLFHRNAGEGLQAFFEKRPPVFR